MEPDWRVELAGHLHTGGTVNTRARGETTHRKAERCEPR